MEDRVAFLLTIGPKHAAGSSFGLTEFRRLADTWGFDSTDYAWELTIDLEGMAPVHYLQFPPEFDLGPTIALLRRARVQRGRPLRGDGVLTPDRLIDHLAADAAGDDERRRPPGREVADPLGIARGARPRAGGRGRRLVLARRRPPQRAPRGSRRARGRARPAGAGRLRRSSLTTRRGRSHRRLRGRAAGTRRSPSRTSPARTAPAGQIVFLYATPVAAAADLAFRAEAARNGRSGRAGRPYADYVFTVEAQSVVGSSVILDVRPGEGAPIRLFQMVWARDMTFAVCSPS